MNPREKLVLAAGRLLFRGFTERAAAFGAGGWDQLPRLNALLARARAALPEYDAACAAAVGGSLASMDDFQRLPLMRRGDLARYAGGGALARLESGGTGSSGRVETRLDLAAVAARYAALLSVLKEAGWSMGQKTAALHPVEYSWSGNLPAMLAGGQFGRIAFEFLQQYGLYRLLHNRKNVYYGGNIFSEPGAALLLARAAAAEDPVLLISRPDALMAVLMSLRSARDVSFRRLKAVLTVGTPLAEAVRSEVRSRLGAEVFNMYASTELGYAGLSCPHSGGWLHADRAGHILEVSAQGGLICTDLDNGLAPVLRYDTGDIGETSERGCLCGRSGLMLKVSGRAGKFAQALPGSLYETELIERAFPSGLPFFQLDAAAGRIMLPPGAGEREAARVRELLRLPPGSYGAAAAGKFKISSSGKFSYLP